MTKLPGGFFLSRAVLVCVGVLSATIAAAELRKSIELSSVSVLADRLRKNPDIELPALQKAASHLELDGSLLSCRSDSLADLLTVQLRYLDRLDQTENYDEWAEGIERATEFVEEAIFCSPADGNLWVRLAMLRQAAVSLPEETDELMKRSVELSPAQINVILARVEVWRKMDLSNRKLALDIFKSEMHSLLAFGKLGDISLANSRLDKELHDIGLTVISSLPIGRHELILGIFKDVR